MDVRGGRVTVWVGARHVAEDVTVHTSIVIQYGFCITGKFGIWQSILESPTFCVQ